jgi:hypothetical protein
MLRKDEYQPCIPTRGTEVPAGPHWFHEIKHDGYRLLVHREVRLLTRRGLRCAEASKPITPPTFCDRSGWDAEDWQCAFEERLAILEYDEGLSRPEAEAVAAKQDGREPRRSLQ